ncbi:MAG TPA: hydroxyacylglutathione hydrolase [Gammaproteobacteria bacterium]|jgi:hydroxyacylglutathione hydrolase|nr:hydroxyacylglutathione hydrolase [Pseudomonadota bacterium]HAY45489.1 hydroxyacylglutathione hydrolase [Gammaproteobacteria bacterium]
MNENPLVVHMFPCLSDNYGYLIHDPESGMTATIDTPDADEICRQLIKQDWQLSHILNTHHHSDHVGGNQQLKQQTGCEVIGPRADASRIPGIDVQFADGDIFQFGRFSATIYDTPGHTRGHIAYHFFDAHVAFVGDTLFALGCGRLFEGTPAQMWNSLQKIMRWDDETLIYCAHEYTQANARFAISIEPENEQLQQRIEWIDQQRKQSLPTVPSTLGTEKATNPFLRPDSEQIQASIGVKGSLVEVFARTRELKDQFRG